MPRLLSLVARTGSRELFILAVVAIALGIATGAAWFGLSVAHRRVRRRGGGLRNGDQQPGRGGRGPAPGNVRRPVSVGMLLDPSVVKDNIGLTVAVLAVVLFGKSLVAVFVSAAFPYPARTGLVVAAGLAQVGEFSFIVADEGLREQLISATTYNVVLAVAVASISLNPLAFRLVEPVEKLLKGRPPIWRMLDRQGEPPSLAAKMHGHAVVCGYGRVGELTGHALQQLGVPFVVIEADLERVRRLALTGIPVVWGDCATLEVLEHASVPDANIVVVATPDESSALLAVANARRLNATAPVLVAAGPRARLRPSVNSAQPKLSCRSSKAGWSSCARRSSPSAMTRRNHSTSAMLSAISTTRRARTPNAAGPPVLSPRSSAKAAGRRQRAYQRPARST